MTATKRIVVHAGYPKTGTSAIQRHLNRHREQLAASGILYPQHGLDVNDVSAGNAGALLYPRSTRVSPEAAEATLRSFERSAHETLLLSSESFSPAIPEIAKVLPSPVKFILYLRDPIEFLESDYNQRVKRGLGRREPFVADPDHLGGWLVHGNLVKTFERVSQDVDIRIRPYHRDLFDGGNILADLFHAAGLGEPPGDFGASRPVNPSYTLASLEFKRAANHFDLEGLGVLGHEVGDTRLIGGRPPQAVCGRA